MLLLRLHTKTPIVARREALKDSIVVKESNPGIIVKHHGGNGVVCVAHGAALAIIQLKLIHARSSTWRKDFFNVQQW